MGSFQPSSYTVVVSHFQLHYLSHVRVVFIVLWEYSSSSLYYYCVYMRFCGGFVSFKAWIYEVELTVILFIIFKIRLKPRACKRLNRDNLALIVVWFWYLDEFCDSFLLMYYDWLGFPVLFLTFSMEHSHLSKKCIVLVFVWKE